MNRAGTSVAEAIATGSGGKVSNGIKVLTLTTVDITLEKLLLPFLRELRDRGFDCECASADGSHAAALRDQGFTVHPISFKRKLIAPSHVLAFIQVYRLIKLRAYQIVHVHTPFAQVIGRIAAKLAGVPVILYTSHGFQFHESRLGVVREAIIRIERWLAGYTDLIFTQSLEDAETAVRIGIAPQDRVLWIGNGVQMDQFQPGPKDLHARREFGFGTEHKVIGFIGRIVREKGVLELIEAMAHVVSRASEARLLIVGDTLASDGDTEAKRLVQEAVLRYKLEDKVRFAGLRNDIPRILRALDIFVLPSWREGMPRSIIEAMAVGLPVVATDIRGCREEVIHGETGLLVPPRNPLRLAEAMLLLVTDQATASRMGNYGRERALNCFDEGMVIQRQIEAYYGLIQRKGLAS